MAARLIALAVAVLSIAGVPARTQAQGPTLAEVLRNAADYVTPDTAPS